MILVCDGNGQSSCEGSQAPHGSDRRFLPMNARAENGVRSNLDLHLSLLIPSGLGHRWGGSPSTGSPAVRVLAGTPGLVGPEPSSCAALGPLQRGGCKVEKNNLQNSSRGNLRRPHWTKTLTRGVACFCGFSAFLACVNTNVRVYVLCGGKGAAPAQ